MKKFTFSQKFRYHFDNIMSKGVIALIGWLGILSIILVVIAAGVVSILGLTQEGDETAPGFIEAAWNSLMRTLDPGTMGGDTGWGFRIVMLGVTLGGIFIVSTLIGVLSSAISEKVEQLRKGRSFVIESGHILILGWSEKIFPIISELVLANENQTKPKIVILADKDKVEMEDEIEAEIKDKKNMKIICRRGNPIEYSDLEIVNPNEARSIVILASTDKDPDINVIKCILALTNNPNRKQDKYHITAEISDIKNKDIAELVGKDEVSLVFSEDLISRVIAQTCRQSGLSIVYTELLDFGGDEIYFKEEQGLTGKTYKESLFVYNDSSVIGLLYKDGRCKINPAMETVISDGDKVIAISEDDDTIVMNANKCEINDNIIINENEETGKPEKILLFNWNKLGANIVRELDNYLAKGSLIKVAEDSTYIRTEVDDLKKEIKNSELIFENVTTTNREVIEGFANENYDHIIILCDSDSTHIHDADAKALMTLLHLRDISNKTGKEFSIVSEMLDIRDKELAEITKADDFIISNRLVSLLMSQLTENKNLKKVFDDLFDADGSEIYLKPVSGYLKTGEATDFNAVIESASRKNQTAIGYRKMKFSKDPDRAYGVVVNPKKSEKITFEEGDKIIVLSEE